MGVKRSKTQTTEELENQEQEEVLDSIVSDEKMGLYDEYFSAGLDAAGWTYPKNHYDYIVFNAFEYQQYYYGTVAAHCLDGLKENGYLIFNSNGSALNMEQVIHVIEFVGLVYNEKESKNGYYVFQKVVGIDD